MEELINRALAGDGEAFTQLMEGQKQILYKVARSYLHSDADAADAIGDTVLACWEKLPALRQPAYFRTWLTRILIRKCQDILRQRRRVVPLEAAPAGPAHRPAGRLPGGGAVSGGHGGLCRRPGGEGPRPGGGAGGAVRE